MTLGGTLIVRNAIQYDFCLEAAVRSLLGVCDEVVVVDGYSDDGTDEIIDKLAEDKRLIPLRSPWTPSPLGTWLSDLTNIARERLTTDFQINVQADEVLHEDSYPEVRRLADTGGIYTVERLNFWLDHRHILPPNEKVGSTIVRLAPQWLPCIGDAQGFEHKQGWERSNVKLFHYGFIRDAKKWAAKSREMQQAFFNTTDPIIDVVEKEGLRALGDVKHATAVPLSRLVPFNGRHPEVAREWLGKHGYGL